MVARLTSDLVFPHPSRASREGVVAVGGDLSPERLLLAYSQGIFPWPSEGMPLLWFSPDPRFVLPLDDVHVPRSLHKRARKGDFVVRADTAFDRVIRACRATPRPGQDGTWITREIVAGYERLFELGFAHSIECFDVEDRLVGGLYGISLGSAFFGESMFAAVPDASKVAFATFLGNARRWGFQFVDCQVRTEHLERFGARGVPRRTFLSMLSTALEAETKRGPWTLSLPPVDALRELERTDQ